MTYEELFAPDRDGLLRAVQQLVDLHGHGGDPVPGRGAARLEELGERLPEDGVGADAALELAAELGVAQAVRLGHPGYLAHMDPPTPWPTWAAHLMAASVNQNLLHPDAAPVGRALEERVVSWLAPVFGMTGGHLVPGSTIANLTALWAARELVGVTEVVASHAAHLSVRKAAHLLGLAYREVPVDEDQRLRPERLGDLAHAALVLTAGTVGTGAVDPLETGTSARWRHVDAAWAGPLRLSDTHGALLDGVEAADSVGFSAHKWLYQPKDAAVVLFRDAEPAHGAVSFGGSYLAAPNVGVLGSRGAGPTLSLLVTLLLLGRRGVSALLDADMARASRLCDLVALHDDLELRAPHVSGVVNWRVRGVDAHAVQHELRGAWVSTTDVDGQTWLRSVAANPAADPDLVVEAVRGAGRRVRAAGRRR